MAETNPCHFCQHYYEYEDRSTGIIDASCNAEDEFAVCEQKPCPYFQSILASDGLFEQLANEEEERFWHDLYEKDEDIQ